MFPDVTRDDIFRLETPRLWLRWPRASDAQEIKGFASLAKTARMTAAIPHPYPSGEAERFVLQSRADNANGKALILVVTAKGAGHRAMGLLSATSARPGEIELGYILAPSVWGRGFASEAARAVVEAVFSLTQAGAIHANTRIMNIASRRVLEKCGFTYVDTGLDLLQARGGLHPCDRFMLDRKSWAKSREGRLMPPMVQQRLDISEPACFEAKAGH